MRVFFLPVYLMSSLAMSALVGGGVTSAAGSALEDAVTYDDIHRSMQGDIDNDCDVAYGIALASDACQVDETAMFGSDVCDTSTCNALLSSVDVVCNGKFYTKSGALTTPALYTVVDLLDLVPMPMTGDGDDCNVVILNFVLVNSVSVSTCQEWSDIHQVAAPLVCSTTQMMGNGTDICPTACEIAIGNFFIICNATEIVTVATEDGAMTDNVTAYDFLENSLSPQWSDECNAYSEGLIFPDDETDGADGGGFFDDVEVTDCDLAFASVLIRSACKEEDVDGVSVCPAACEDLLVSIYSTCKGGTINDSVTSGGVDVGTEEEHDFAAHDLLFLALVLGGDCRFEPYHLFSSGRLGPADITCEDWLIATSTASAAYCRQECTELCKDLLLRTYSACDADFIFIDTNLGSVTAPQFESVSSQLRSDECNAFADTLEFGVMNTRQPTSSPTPIAPSAAPTDMIPTSSSSSSIFIGATKMMTMTTTFVVLVIRSVL